MKFLVDNQLPAALARHLSAQGLTAMHVLTSHPQATVQVIWVRLGNCRKATLLTTFDALLPQILDALNTGSRVVEVR